MPASVAEHYLKVLDVLAPLERLGQQTVPLEQANRRVLAADMSAPRSLPPFDNSQMDGYAIRTSDLAAGTAAVQPGASAPAAALKVTASIPAGTAPPPLPAGSAAPIMTGAMLPDGADAVVPIEQAVPDTFLPDDGGPHTVALPADTPAQQFIRPAGSDIAAGATALAAGTLLGAAQLGLLAALGLTQVPVRRRPTVLLLATGDEVVPPGGELAPGRIFDANTTLLRTALQDAGVEVRNARILADEATSFDRQLRDDLQQDPVDLVLTAGGISKGAYEVVRQALQSQPVEFAPVKMQPGGPQAVGSVEGVPFLGFPGNPVSCLVSFEMFLRPALGTVTGYPPPRPDLAATLAEPVSSPVQTYQVRRGRFATDGTVRLVGGPGSHLVHALAEANALVHLPAGTGELAAGEQVRVWLLELPNRIQKSPYRTEGGPA